MTDIINEISINLSKDQQIAFDLIKQGHTVFITSAAGSGKSFLLKHIIEYLSEIYNPLDGSYAVTSLTGISSIQIEGQTLHSWAGIGLGEENAPILISKIKKEEWSFIFRFNTTTYYYTKFLTLQLKIIVTVHGVFPSN